MGSRGLLFWSIVCHDDMANLTDAAVVCWVSLLIFMTGTAILLRLPTVNRTFSFVPVSENRFFKNILFKYSITQMLFQ